MTEHSPHINLAKSATHVDVPRVVGLDSLRGMLALVVVMFHDAMPPFMLGYDSTSSILRKINALFSWSLNGQMAVVVFFLISGFCIHYPYVTRPLQPIAFYTNRALRLALPAFAAIILTWMLVMRRPLQLNGVPIWSLWCELTYYLLYPLFLIIIRRGRLNVLLIVSYIFAFIILSLYPAHDRYHEYGYLGTTTIGLPVWLLGCFFAENISKSQQRQSSPGRIWIFRTTMLIVSCATLTASSVHLLGLGWSLTLVSPLLYFWVREETTYFATVKTPPPVLEAIGRFSYSIYLLHMLILFIISKTMLDRLGGNMVWIIKMAIVLGISYMFYLTIEAPAHRLSRRMAENVRRRTTKLAIEI